MLSFKVYVIMFTIIIVSSFWDVQAAYEVGSSSSAPQPQLPVPDGVSYDDVARNCKTFLETFSTFYNNYKGDRSTYRNTKSGNTIKKLNETGKKLLADFRQHYWQYLLGNDELLAKQTTGIYGEYLCMVLPHVSDKSNPMLQFCQFFGHNCVQIFQKKFNLLEVLKLARTQDMGS